MSSLKTLVLLILLIPGSARAGQLESETISAHFATCLGRYSAQVFHDHLMRRDADADMRRQRAFADIFEASAPSDPGRLMAQRIDAKMRFAALLRIAEFHTDPAQARRAARLVRSHLRACDTLVLG